MAQVEELQPQHYTAARKLVVDYGLRDDGNLNLYTALQHDGKLLEVRYLLECLKKLSPDQLYRLIVQAWQDELDARQLAAQWAAELAHGRIPGVGAVSAQSSPSVSAFSALVPQLGVNQVGDAGAFVPNPTTSSVGDSTEHLHKLTIIANTGPTSDHAPFTTTSGAAPAPVSDTGTRKRTLGAKKQHSPPWACPGKQGHCEYTCRQKNAFINHFREEVDDYQRAVNGGVCYICLHGCLARFVDADELIEHMFYKHANTVGDPLTASPSVPSLADYAVGGQQHDAY